eukprot:gene15028-20219_t
MSEQVIPQRNMSEQVIPQWYVSGASAAQQCENLLASSEWQSTKMSYGGIISRLKMMSDAGLPKMRVIPATKIEELGHIPRSNEGHAVDALEEVIKCGGEDGTNTANAIIVFFSHRWMRPNWCEHDEKDLLWGSEERAAADAAGYIIGDVDDMYHTKAKSLIQWSKWFIARLKTRGTFDGDLESLPLYDERVKIFFWIDWPCVDQLNPGPDMAALPAYVAVSNIVAAAWNDEYYTRSWCQVELMMANAFCAGGDRIWVVPEYEISIENISWNSDTKLVPDPLNGNMTNPNDKTVIANLRMIAMNSKSFTCYRVFIRNSTQSILLCVIFDIFLCCQCFGCLACCLTRNVRPGSGELKLIIPDKVPSKSIQDNKDNISSLEVSK